MFTNVNLIKEFARQIIDASKNVLLLVHFTISVGELSPACYLGVDPRDLRKCGPNLLKSKHIYHPMTLLHSLGVEVEVFARVESYSNLRPCDQ